MAFVFMSHRIEYEKRQAELFSDSACLHIFKCYSKAYFLDSLAQLSFKPTVLLNTRCSGVESLSTLK